MGTAQLPGDAAAAWVRRAGPGTFERAHRALPYLVRREQYAGGELHYAGAIFSPVAPPDVRRGGPARRAQAAGDLHAQEPVAAPASRFHGARSHGDRKSTRLNSS